MGQLGRLRQLRQAGRRLAITLSRMPQKSSGNQASQRFSFQALTPRRHSLSIRLSHAFPVGLPTMIIQTNHCEFPYGLIPGPRYSRIPCKSKASSVEYDIRGIL